MFQPGHRQNLFLRHRKLQTWFLLWVKFSGPLFPEHPFEYPTDSSAVCVLQCYPNRRPHDNRAVVRSRHVGPRELVEAPILIWDDQKVLGIDLAKIGEAPNQKTLEIFPTGPPANPQWFLVFLT